MKNEVLVVQLDDADSERGQFKLLASAEEARGYIASLVAQDVPPERLVLFSAKTIPFTVAFQPVVMIDGGETPPDAAPQESIDPRDDSAERADGEHADGEGEPALAGADGPGYNQKGVRFSAMLRPT